MPISQCGGGPSIGSVAPSIPRSSPRDRPARRDAGRQRPRWRRRAAGRPGAGGGRGRWAARSGPRCPAGPTCAPEPARPAGSERSVPEATVARLAVYLRVLHDPRRRRPRARSPPRSWPPPPASTRPKLRKDLSHLGPYGTRGVGYEVAHAASTGSRACSGSSSAGAVALVGIGNLGHALADYAGFGSAGLPSSSALFDADPARVGRADRRADRPAHRRAARTSSPRARCLHRRHRDPGRGRPGGLRPAGRGRGHEHPELRAGDAAASRTGSTSARSTSPIELQILSFHEHRKASLGALAHGGGLAGGGCGHRRPEAIGT